MDLKSLNYASLYLEFVLRVSSIVAINDAIKRRITSEPYRDNVEREREVLQPMKLCREVAEQAPRP